MAALTLHQVSRVFGGAIRAVDRLTLDVPQGEFMVLVGPSGCGKTTTLRLIAGLEEASEGEICIGGQAVDRLPAHRRNVALVFQHPVLLPHLTVRQNIAFGLREQTRRNHTSENGSTSIAERVADMARALGIVPLLERMPRQLSGGEQQRVALGRSLVRQPAVFLLDEPLASLDPGLRREMQKLLAHLHQQMPTTTLYVTHDQVEALTLGTRIAVMKDGQIEQVGTPQEIYRHPKNRFVAQFIGSLPMNVLNGELAQENSVWKWKGAFGSINVPVEVVRQLATNATGQIQLGLRPEDIRLTSKNEVTSSLPARVLAGRSWGDFGTFDLRLGDEYLPTNGSEHQDSTVCVTLDRAPVGLVPGDRVRVVFDWQRALWFDRVSGREITTT